MADFDERKSDISFPEHIDYVKMRPIPPKVPHWFYEREDGSVIDVDEETAFAIEKDVQRSRKLRRYGFSDGTACFEYLKNCGFKPGQEVEYEKAKEIQKAAYDAEVEAGKGKWRRPRHKAGHFDSSITNHQNADSIMRSFGI